MESENIRVWFAQGYSGGVKVGVTIGDKSTGHTYGEIQEKKLSRGVDYVMDLDWLKAYLEKQMSEKGYTTGITVRQKYPRITIND